MSRYFVRWRTKRENGNLILSGWDVCDWRAFDKIEVASFAADERDKADAICKLLNSNEEHYEAAEKKSARAKTPHV